MMKYISIMLLIFTVSACIPEENPISQTGDISSNIGSTGDISVYEKQIYYNLASNSVVLDQDQYLWDIAFSSSSDEIVIFNYAGAMSAAIISEQNFDDITRDDALAIDQDEFQFDRPEGPEHGTALRVPAKGEPSLNYIINRSLIISSSKERFVKIQLMPYDGKYRFRYQMLDGKSEPISVEINKQPDYNYIGYSFTTDSLVVMEPRKDSWHLLFSHNAELLEAEPGDSVVYGVKSAILNQYYAEAAPAPPDTLAAVLGESKTFDEITIQDAIKFVFSSRRNAVGHEWKDVDISNGQYTIKDDHFYFLRDLDGHYFKLRFIDYYNKGIKGYPQFEIGQL